LTIAFVELNSLEQTLHSFIVRVKVKCQHKKAYQPSCFWHYEWIAII